MIGAGKGRGHVEAEGGSAPKQLLDDLKRSENFEELTSHRRIADLVACWVPNTHCRHHDLVCALFDASNVGNAWLVGC